MGSRRQVVVNIHFIYFRIICSRPLCYILHFCQTFKLITTKPFHYIIKTHYTHNILYIRYIKFITVAIFQYGVEIPSSVRWFHRLPRHLSEEFSTSCGFVRDRQTGNCKKIVRHINSQWRSYHRSTGATKKNNGRISCDVTEYATAIAWTPKYFAVTFYHHFRPFELVTKRSKSS